MPHSSDIDSILGLTQPVKRKRPRFRKVLKTMPRPRRYYIPPQTRDTDLIKLENLHGGFCACGRRMSGEAACGHCLNGLDYDQSFV